MQHQAKIEWKGKMHFEAHSNGGTVPLDSSPDFGGEGKGLSPKPLILDSLGGCMGMDISSLSNKMRADENLISFDIDVTGDLTTEHPKYYNKISILIKFYGQDLKEEKLKKIVKMSIDKYCGVYAMLKTFAEITTNIEFLHKKVLNNG